MTLSMPRFPPLQEAPQRPPPRARARSVPERLRVDDAPLRQRRVVVEHRHLERPVVRAPPAAVAGRARPRGRSRSARSTSGCPRRAAAARRARGRRRARRGRARSRCPRPWCSGSTPSGESCSTRGEPPSSQFQVFITWPTTAPPSSATNESSGSYTLARAELAREPRHAVALVTERDAVDLEESSPSRRRSRRRITPLRASGGSRREQRAEALPTRAGRGEGRPRRRASSAKIAAASASRADCGLPPLGREPRRAARGTLGAAAKIRRTTSCGATVPFQWFSSRRNATS